MHFIEIEGIKVHLQRKRIKNFNLTVKAPYGEVKLSYPYRASKKDYEYFILSKISWIKKQQIKFSNIEVPKPLQYKSGEKIWFLGEEYHLVVQVSSKRLVEIKNNKMYLFVLKTDNIQERKQLVHDYYRKEFYLILLPIVKKWEPIMQVSVDETRIRNMKTLWGSCNINARRIWLNLQLIKYEIDCIEYVVVHEMVHLHERLHSPRFYKLMDHFLPDWRQRQALLNQINEAN